MVRISPRCDSYRGSCLRRSKAAPLGLRSAAGIGVAPALRRSASSSAGVIASWIEDRLEASRRELLNLLIREVDAVALSDARADVAHDLLDIHGLAMAAVILRRRRPASGASTGRRPR